MSPTATETSSQSTADSTISQWVSAFGDALETGSISDALNLFQDDCHWRDLSSLTWNFYSMEGKDSIRKMLTQCLDQAKPRNFKFLEASQDDGFVLGWFTFETEYGFSKCVVRVKNHKCWTLMTALQELKGFEEPVGSRRWRGTEHGVQKNRRNWLDKKTELEGKLGISEQPYVLLVGGGQGGIGLAARLKQLGVPALVCDKHPKAGDQWRSRYNSLCLHDPVWYDHLPYLPFPSNWPTFCPKDKIGDWLEMYTKIMELNYWSNAEVKKATFNDKEKHWDVKVNHDGKTVKLTPKHLVMALGVSGFPHVPKFKGADIFKGDQHHSSQHPSGAKYKGKKVVVVGSNNSAHDICADLWENDADVTMLQRSSTHIIQSNSLMKFVVGPLYSEEAVANGITTEKADMLFGSFPFKVMPEFHRKIFEQVKEHDKEFYDNLAKVGFKCDFGDDESGMFLKYLRRGSGYYINVGASELLIDGSIKLKQGYIDEIKEHSVILNDGTELECDCIVYATGYGTQSEWVERIISPEVADKVGRCWGLGSNTLKDPGPWEGEIRNMWKPTRQENLWFHGGNLAQSRHYSKYLAMGLKARYEGLDTPVYGLPEKVHHLR